jgi:hypothetical protein
MQNDIQQKLKDLKDNQLFESLSAFNGFAIYRTEKFKDIFYDGFYHNIKEWIDDKERKETINFLRKEIKNENLMIDENFIECCEHIYYHLSAIKKNNVKIRISKYYLY